MQLKGTRGLFDTVKSSHTCSLATAMCTNTPKPSTARILGYVAQIRIPSAPATPHFCGFQASESPNEPPRSPYQWSLGGAGGQPGPRRVGANSGSTRVPGAKKIIFSKVVPRPPWMLKQVFLARFELVVGRFGPWKMPKCFKMGRFGTKNESKMGQKHVFPKVILDHFGCSNKCF